ncbi:MAG: ankyrin repeat domain-containing protein [Candidatus Dormibacteraeota bacterium]|nr:ankyrin repeat domain-containing protein [Candidatus Dormibacteraeota bacterium]
MGDSPEPSLVEQCVAAAHGDLDRVRELVEAHPELVDARAPWNESPIEAASQLGRKDIIEYLLSRGAALDFFAACALGRVDVVGPELARDGSLATAHGVHDLPAIYFPVVAGERGVTELLLAHGAPVNSPAGTTGPLHAAVKSGRLELVDLLLEQGADPTLPDGQGRTATQLAEAAGIDLHR